ncbi:MAG TPA: hypothetical protein VNP95_06115, partial [Thermomicrobiales bacterium]|nr:hypothetical protein [Thermomicrobiales bacterium]
MENIGSDPSPSEDIPTTTASFRARLIEVAVNVAAGSGGRGVFTYAVPEDWGSEGELAPGQLVWTPIRNRVELGIVLGPYTEVPTFSTKELHAPVSPPHILSPDRLDMALWIAEETACPVFAAASLFLPPGVSHRKTEVLLPTGRGEAELDTPLTAMQRKLLALVQARGEITVEAARRELNQALTAVIPKLADLGMIRVEIRVDQLQRTVRMLRFIRVLSDDLAPVRGAPRQQEVMEELAQLRRFRREGEDDLIPLAELRERIDLDNATIQALKRKGLI